MLTGQFGVFTVLSQVILYGNGSSTNDTLGTHSTTLKIGIISKDFENISKEMNTYRNGTRIISVLTSSITNLYDYYEILEKASSLHRSGATFIVADAMSNTSDNHSKSPLSNLPVITLQCINKNKDDFEDGKKGTFIKSLYSSRKMVNFIMTSAASLIRKLEWKLVVVIFDGYTDNMINCLLSSLQENEVTLVKYNLDEWVSREPIQNLLTTIYNNFHEIGFNIAIICRHYWIEYVLAEANKFDSLEENFQRTALYMKSQWLIVWTYNNANSINVDRLNLFNVAFLVVDVLLDNHEVYMDYVKLFFDTETDSFQCSNDVYTNESTLIITIDHESIDFHMIQLVSRINTLLWTTDGRAMTRVKHVSNVSNVQTQVYPNHNFGFNGRRFIVTTIVFYPFTMRKTRNGTTSLYGYCIDLLDELASSLNFTFNNITIGEIQILYPRNVYRYEISEVADNEFGALLPNGSWTGMVGLLERRRADLVAAALTVEARREMVMDFTYPYYFDSMTFLLRRPDGSESKWHVFLNPFHWLVFVCVCLTLPVGTLSLYFIENCARYFKHSSWKPRSYQYTFLYLFSTLITQGGERLELTRSGRIFMSAWWIFSIIIAETYCGNLVAFLTVTKEKAPVNTFEELVSQTDYKWGTIGGSIYETLFQNSSNPTFLRLWEGIKEQYLKDPNILHKEQEVHIKKVLDEDYVYLFDRTYFEILSRNDCRYTIAGEEYPSIQYGFGLPNKSPYTKLFSDKIIQLLESGFHYRWVEKYWPKNVYCKKALRTEAKRMTIIDMQSAFYLIGIGSSLALVILLIECITLRFIKFCSKE